MPIYHYYYEPGHAFKAYADVLDTDPTAKLTVDTDNYGKPCWTIAKYHGRVVATGYIGWHDDTDYTATVYFPEEGVFKDVMYDTTRFAGGGSCGVDATPEIRKIFEDMILIKETARIQAEIENERRTIRKDKWIKVVKGRKTPIGTTGLVFWIGTDNYNNTKLGISPSGIRGENKKFNDAIFVYAKNCEVDLEKMEEIEND